MKTDKVNVLNKEISFYKQKEEDYICITDIAKYKDEKRTDYIIQNWLRNRNTIEFLGIWEHLNNPNLIMANIPQLEAKQDCVT